MTIFLNTVASLQYMTNSEYIKIIILAQTFCKMSLWSKEAIGIGFQITTKRTEYSKYVILIIIILTKAKALPTSQINVSCDFYLENAAINLS